MSFVGVTFDGQNVSPKDDGALYQSRFRDGIIDGCSMSISGDNFVIQSGHFLSCGRMWKVDGATELDLSARQNLGYVRIYTIIDLTQAEGSQTDWNFDESATTTFADLNPDPAVADINGNGTIYKMAIAVIEVSGGSLTNITWKIGYAGLFTHGFSDYSRDDTTRVYTASDTGGGSINFEANGDKKGGFFVNSNGVLLAFSETNSSFYIRPKGLSNTANETQFMNTGEMYAGGQIHNAIGYYTASDWNAATFAQYTWYSKCGISLPAGRYLCVGIASTKGAGNTSGARIVIQVGNNNRSIASDSCGFPLNFDTTVNSSHNFCFSLSTSTATTFYVWLDSQVNNLGFTGCVWYAYRMN